MAGLNSQNVELSNLHRTQLRTIGKQAAAKAQQSELRMHIAAMESVLLCEQMPSWLLF
jgi:hypothetical protein